MGRNARFVKLLNIWGMDSVIGMTFQELDHSKPVNVFNVYGPCLNRIPFWDSLFTNSILGGDMVVIGGDLNFSLGQVEVWGKNARQDLLTEYFTHKLVEKNWIDTKPLKLKPTWKNTRCGEARVAKRLDHFLVTEQMVERNHSFR